MATKLTAEDAKQSLTEHAAVKGAEIYEKYGPLIGWKQLLQILEDRACCRYPCEILFDAAPLQPGECACPVPKGEWPEEGFTMHVHPRFMAQLERVPYLALYQLVVVNYGEFASPQDAELLDRARSAFREISTTRLSAPWPMRLADAENPVAAAMKGPQFASEASPKLLTKEN